MATSYTRRVLIAAGVVFALGMLLCFLQAVAHALLLVFAGLLLEVTAMAGDRPAPRLPTSSRHPERARAAGDAAALAASRLRRSARVYLPFLLPRAGSGDRPRAKAL
jgi:hypothetical protein